MNKFNTDHMVPPSRITWPKRIFFPHHTAKENHHQTIIFPHHMIEACHHYQTIICLHHTTEENSFSASHGRKSHQHLNISFSLHHKTEKKKKNSFVTPRKQLYLNNIVQPPYLQINSRCIYFTSNFIHKYFLTKHKIHCHHHNYLIQPHII